MVISKISAFIFVAKAFLLVLAEPYPESYRLPSFYEPIDYTITLRLNREIFKENGTRFDGEVEIRFFFNTAVDYIALHSHHDMIKLNKITFENDEIPASNYSVNNVTDILTIKMGKRIVPNLGYHLFINYTGEISTEDLYGVYRSSYIGKGRKTKIILTTQLGTTFTRRVFPCFDEPRFRTRFNFTFIYPTGLHVIFSTKEMNRTTDSATGMVTAVFHQTPKIPAGSLSFVVSDFTCSGSRWILTLQVCSEDEDDFNFFPRRLALEIAVKLLGSLNRFTKYNYNKFAQKLDIVAVPDFPAYAASGFGLQLHRNSKLLVDAIYSSYESREEVIYIMAHELAHQWFGNLLSCPWYSEVYMDEGLARFLEFYTVNEVLPKYMYDDKRFVVKVLQPILAVDGKGDALPLRVENVTTLSEIIETYSEIPYNKGSSIIRMVHYFMTLENFRQGIRNYIERHKFGLVEGEDLWTALNETIVDEISLMPANLSTVMQNWTRKTGYPLVTVSIDGGNLTINQSRFSYDGLDNETKWYIPISYTESGHDSKFESTTPNFWLTPDSDFQISFPAEDDWIILNNQQIGYYRVNYDSNLWTRIKNGLQNKNFSGIIDINRAQIVDDLFNLARADILPYSSVLDTIRFLKNDTSYYPWKAATEGFELLLRRVGEFTKLGKAIGKDMLGLINNFYHFVPIDRKSTNRSYNLMELLAAEWACRLGHANCIEKTKFRFQEYKRRNKSPAVELKPVIYCNGLRHSDDDSDWYFLWNVLVNGKHSAADEAVLRTALACTKNVTLLRHYLQMTITKDSIIRPQDTLEVFLAVIDNPVGVDVALNFLLENQELIVEYYQSMGSIEFILLSLMDRLSEEQIIEVIELINNGSLKEGFSQYAEKAKFTANLTRIWLHKHLDELKAYYPDQPSGISYWWYALLIIPITIIFCGVNYYFWRYRQEQYLNFVDRVNIYRDFREWFTIVFQTPEENIEMEQM